MQYLLTHAEFDELQQKAKDGEQFLKDRHLLRDLRAKVMELARFTCFHDLDEKEYSKRYVDEGYCDPCPLSFCSNEGKEARYKMCGHDTKLYSK